MAWSGFLLTTDRKQVVRKQNLSQPASRAPGLVTQKACPTGVLQPQSLNPCAQRLDGAGRVGSLLWRPSIWGLTQHGRTFLALAENQHLRAGSWAELSPDCWTLGRVTGRNTLPVGLGSC